MTIIVSEPLLPKWLQRGFQDSLGCRELCLKKETERKYKLNYPGLELVLLFLGTKEGVGRMEGRVTGHIKLWNDRRVCFLKPGSDFTGLNA